MKQGILTAIILSFSLMSFSQLSFSYLEDTVRVCQEDMIILEGDQDASVTNHTWTFSGATTNDMNMLANKSGKYYYTANANGTLIKDSVVVSLIKFEIEAEKPIICRGDRIALNVRTSGFGLSYDWAHTDEDEGQIFVRPLVSATYNIEVSDGINSCSDAIDIEVTPGMNVRLTELNQSCFGDNDGQMKASVRGGTQPYTFQWFGAGTFWDSIASQMAPGLQQLSITDAGSCEFDTSFVLGGIKAPKVEILVDPDDQNIFLQNPTAQFSFEVKSDDEVVNWEWDFGNGETSKLEAPLYTYENMDEDFESGMSEYNILLTLENEFKCDTVITKTLGMKEANIFIPNAIAPNSSSLASQVFALFDQVRTYDENAYGSKGAPIDYEYFSVDLVVFDRYGKVVYRESNYKGDWNGGGLNDGVYFYVAKLAGKYTTEEYHGAIHIINNIVPNEE